MSHYDLPRGCSELSGHCPRADPGCPCGGRRRVARRIAVAPLVAAAPAPRRRPRCPGPAPNQSQINATQSQVAQIESTLTQEEQQTSILDDKYNTAEQNLQNAQNQLQALAASLVRAKIGGRGGQEARGDRRGRRLRLRHARDRLHVLLLLVRHAEPGAQPVHGPDRRQPDQGRDARSQSSETQLQSEETQQQSVAAQAQTEAAQAKSLAQANEQEAATTKATLGQVQGQLAQEVAQAAIAGGAAGSGRGGAAPPARRSSNRRPPRPRRRPRWPARSAVRPAARRRPTPPTRRRARRAGRRHRVGRRGADGGRPGGGVPARRALCLRWRAARGGLRLLRPRAVGLGAGRGLHPPDDRDRSGRRSPTSRSTPSNPVTCSSITTSTATTRSTTSSCTRARGPTAPTP